MSAKQVKQKKTSQPANRNGKKRKKQTWEDKPTWSRKERRSSMDARKNHQTSAMKSDIAFSQ